MRKFFISAIVAIDIFIATVISAMPTVYPTGTTIYKPDRAWNGYTVFPAAGDLPAVMIDMNGNAVKLLEGLEEVSCPIKMLPGGIVMGGLGTRKGYQEVNRVVKVDWDGNILWSFNGVEEIKDKDAETYWSARQHHDYQMEGNPVGYYVPGMDFKERGNVLILSHKNWINPDINQKTLLDDLIVEVDYTGKIIWQWLAGEHFNEMGFDEAARKAIAGNLGRSNDWIHINNVNYLGPNKWFDKGDERFHPDNIITDGREANIIMIIDKKTGMIVWKLGPDFTGTPALKNLGQIVGQHHVHMIPRGLPGEGNILVFDNGGEAGYGSPNPGAPAGIGNAKRDYSRVIEFDPITLEIKWQYTFKEAGYFMTDSYKFYSHYISAAQRLPNGNTMITEGADGRIFEVTADHELVWEYVSPYFVSYPGGKPENRTWNLVYRAYRVPYEWVPQLKRPKEKSVIPPANGDFIVPGTTRAVRDGAVTRVKADEQKSGM